VMVCLGATCWWAAESAGPRPPPAGGLQNLLVLVKPPQTEVAGNLKQRLDEILTISVLVEACIQKILNSKGATLQKFPCK
jgi:hypothetical protein